MTKSELITALKGYEIKDKPDLDWAEGANFMLKTVVDVIEEVLEESPSLSAIGSDEE